MRRDRRSPRLVALLRATDQVKELFPDPSGANVDDYDAASDSDELHETVIGGVWERVLTEEARDRATELVLSLLARDSTTAEQRAALSRLLEALREWEVIAIRTDELDALVASLVAPRDDLLITRSISGDVVEVRVAPASEGVPNRRALISTPGDWWVSLRVDDGYADSVLVREPASAELTECVRRYVRAAEHYVRCGGVRVRVGRMRWPALKIGEDGEGVVLPRIVSEHVRSTLRARPSARGRDWF